MTRMLRMWRRRLCCAPTTGLKGYTSAHDFVRGWFELVFALRWTGSVPLSAGRRGKRNGFSKIPATRPIRARAPIQRQFDRAMDELPEKQRLVLFLAAMEGHTLQEVSSLLRIPVGTVKSRLFVARKTLAEKLRCFVNPTANR